MYSWNYDPNYVTVGMAADGKDAQKYKVQMPSRYDKVVFTPSQLEDKEAMEIHYALQAPSVDAEDDVIDLRHTTHSLKRQLRLRRYKRALVGLVVALALTAVAAVVVIVVLGLKTSEPTPNVNTTTAYKDCESNQFTCSLGECIPDRWRCDDRLDCQNGIDEEQCDNFTGFPIRSCDEWNTEFRTHCPTPGCPFYPSCTPTGHWDPLQCTVENASCWCVDWATGATVPGSFVADVGEAGQPFCEMKPA